MPDWNTILETIQENLLELEVENAVEAWHKRIDEIFKSMSDSEQWKDGVKAWNF